MEKEKAGYKRVNILIRADQYEQVTQSNLSLSGLVRDLLDDRFNRTSIVLSVTPEVRKMYDMVVSNFGSSDRELGKYLVEALDQFLIDRSKLIEELRINLKKGPEGV